MEQRLADERERLFGRADRQGRIAGPVRRRCRGQQASRPDLVVPGQLRGAQQGLSLGAVARSTLGSRGRSLEGFGCDLIRPIGCGRKVPRPPIRSLCTD